MSEPPPGVPFDEETWRQLPAFLDNLPEPVCLHVWGDAAATPAEGEAARLAALLADRSPQLSYRLSPRRADYPYYPVIGVMRGTAAAAEDDGLRLIGLPLGYQMTSLIAAIQAVGFRGQTLEPATRIRLSRLPAGAAIAIELLTAAEDEWGGVAAKVVFGMAAASAHIRAYLIMTDFFPEAAQRYSVTALPHVVIDRRVHFSGPPDEAALLRHIGLSLKAGPPAA